MKPNYEHVSGNLFYQLMVLAFLSAIILSMISCGTQDDLRSQNTIKLRGYIGSVTHPANPVTFVTDSASYFVYEYKYDPMRVRVERTVLVYSDDNRLIFIAERF